MLLRSIFLGGWPLLFKCIIYCRLTKALALLCYVHEIWQCIRPAPLCMLAFSLHFHFEHVTAAWDVGKSSAAARHIDQLDPSSTISCKIQ
ncbi:hypothetical protein BDZ45DRAFT_682232 [Acephala macrosclerotiorum]|nr:hypothetical protein BDZ45DRAFT_682232 [Acephala macrosclerotiorum]